MELGAEARSDLKSYDAHEVDDKWPFSTKSVRENSKSQSPDRSEQQGKGDRRGNLVCIRGGHVAEKSSGQSIDRQGNAEKVCEDTLQTISGAFPGIALEVEELAISITRPS